MIVLPSNEPSPLPDPTPYSQLLPLSLQPEKVGQENVRRYFLCFFRPPEELLHKKCGTLRGGLDCATPGAPRVFLV